jgi:hypothetical protein
MNTPFLLMAQYGGKAIIPIVGVSRLLSASRTGQAGAKDIGRSDSDPACAHRCLSIKH